MNLLKLCSPGGGSPSTRPNFLTTGSVYAHEPKAQASHCSPLLLDPSRYQYPHLRHINPAHLLLTPLAYEKQPIGRKLALRGRLFSWAAPGIRYPTITHSYSGRVWKRASNVKRPPAHLELTWRSSNLSYPAPPSPPLSSHPHCRKQCHWRKGNQRTFKS